MTMILKYECRIMIRGHASFWINIQGEHKILRFLLQQRIEWGVANTHAQFSYKK